MKGDDLALAPTEVIGVEFHNQKKAIIEKNLPSHGTSLHPAVAHFTYPVVHLCILHGFLYLSPVCMQYALALQTTGAQFVVRIINCTCC